MEDIPPHHFFLEYIARPQTAETFFEDVLMACVFYGMPLLCENNKPRLLYHFKRRGYRGYAMNRPDKIYNKLSVTEREIGGIPNSSQDIIQAHAAAIESYIEEYTGLKEDGTYGDPMGVLTRKQRLAEDLKLQEAQNKTKPNLVQTPSPTWTVDQNKQQQPESTKVNPQEGSVPSGTNFKPVALSPEYANSIFFDPENFAK